MNHTIRNQIIAEHEYLIKSAVSRNIRLINSLRLEVNDVYQDLMIIMIKAIDSYPVEPESIAEHIQKKLQSYILDLKKTYKPCGMTGTGDKNVTFISIECFYNENIETDVHAGNDMNEIEIFEIFASLSPAERQTVLMKMNGYTPRAKKTRTSFLAAREKILAML